MPDVTWRDAGPEDALLLGAIGRRSFIETFGHLYAPENLTAFLDNHSEANWRGELTDPAYKVRLGFVDGVNAAYAKLGPPKLPFEAKGETVELKQFYVLQPWHGAGLAAEMMDWVIAETKRRGAEAIHLSVFVDNIRAQRFYARYGFQEVGRYAFMVGTHADEDLIMRLAL
ncbi:MAG TPA: GNAT family N-acetyltransferase [Allosphingosinicella sp.]|nr:GNAT family N-acetyltransferase [Allosphingosinicella sp.]